MKYRLIAEPNKNYSPMQQILVNRGIAPQDIEGYIKSTDADILPNELLDNIEYAAVTILTCMRDKRKMFVQVDSDCDGYTASASLINYLYKIDPEYVNNYLQIRVHNGKEHGIIPSTVGDDISLVIIPDAGSNQYEEHKELKDRGIDVIVIDHHEAEKVSEDAIVVNNQLSENYPNKSLSGVGVVYKLCCVIDKIMEVAEANSILDLVALGMIADMMDLRSIETKHLIGKGLANIQNPFFKGLVERQSYSLGGTITPIGVAFYIAPLVNATIRVGTQQEKETMFKAMLSHLAYEQIPSTKRGCKGQFETIVEQAVRNATNVRNRQKRTRDAGMMEVEKIIAENNLDENKVILVNTTNILDKNLTGLVANQIMAKYQKPTLLLREVVCEETGNVTLQGSGRGYDKSELSDLKEFLQQSNFFDYTEGHANAFGAGIQKEFADDFIAYANKELANYDFTACYDVDFIYHANDFKPQDILDIASMKPLWGKGLDEAFVVIKGVKVTKTNVTLMSKDKNPTLKITLPNGTSLIKFGSSEEEYNSLLTDGYVEVDVLGTTTINEWMGNITPQILVKELEVVGQQAYYF